MLRQSKTFVLVSLSIACLSCCSADVVSDVCAKAANPASCKNIFGSDPNAIQAKDVSTLGSIAIDKAVAFAKSAKDAASSIAKTSQDKSIKSSLDSCVENFDDALSSLEECKEALAKKDKASLNIKASAAYTNADTCNEDLEGESEPPNVQEAAQNFVDTCSVLLAISNML